MFGAVTASCVFSSQQCAVNLAQQASNNSYSLLHRHTSFRIQHATCSRLSTVRVATGPKRSMGHILGAEKDFFFIRGDDAALVHGGRTG